MKGKIEFRNVQFAYPTKKDKMILKNLSFTIQPGQKVALVGHSGSGKSTVLQLLERFYDIEKGEILIDDIPLKEYPRKTLVRDSYLSLNGKWDIAIRKDKILNYNF